MRTSIKTAPEPGAPSAFLPFGDQSEDDQIAQLIKLFDLDPVLRTPQVIAVTGDTRTDYFARTSPTNKLFDPTYPSEINRRRSCRASRRYWTVDILRWRIRQAQADSR